VLANLNNVFNRWKNYSSQLLNVHVVNSFRQAETHITEPVVNELSYFKSNCF
jgi:hypothetical protein